MVLSAACVFSGSVSEGFEAEELVPVRVSGRTGRRVAKSSEDHPTFRLTAFGRNFTLNLQPDTSFISPSMKVYHIRAKHFSAAERQVPVSDLTSVKMSKTATAGSELRSCFFTGTVDFVDSSVVSVSLCHGIVGSFISDGDEYHIRPKHFGTGTHESATDQPHVITRQQLTRTLRDSIHSLAQADGESRPVSVKLSTVTSGSSRRRRFVSVPRFIETLVVADASVSSFYGEDTKASGQTHEQIPFHSQFLTSFTRVLPCYTPCLGFHLTSLGKIIIMVVEMFGGTFLRSRIVFTSDDCVNPN